LLFGASPDAGKIPETNPHGGGRLTARLLCGFLSSGDRFGDEASGGGMYIYASVENFRSGNGKISYL
jgi:hypothetical protein